MASTPKAPTPKKKYAVSWKNEEEYVSANLIEDIYDSLAKAKLGAEDYADPGDVFTIYELVPVAESKRSNLLVWK